MDFEPKMIDVPPEVLGALLRLGRKAEREDFLQKFVNGQVTVSDEDGNLI